MFRRLIVVQLSKLDIDLGRDNDFQFPADFPAVRLCVASSIGRRSDKRFRVFGSQKYKQQIEASDFARLNAKLDAQLDAVVVPQINKR